MNLHINESWYVGNGIFTIEYHDFESFDAFDTFWYYNDDCLNSLLWERGVFSVD